MAPSDLSMGWIDAFLDALQAERGAARNTVLAYTRDLTDLRDWLSTQGDETLADAGRGRIETYLSHLDDQGRTATTRARRLSSLRQFYKFAFSERSEEHTSELQSRETISYAVFCLKKKKNKTLS